MNEQATIKVRFGNRILPGIIISERNDDYLNVALSFEGADDPITTLIHREQIQPDHDESE